MRVFLLVLSLLTISSNSFADFAFGYGKSTLDSQAAQEEGVEDDVQIVTFSYDKRHTKSAYSMGLNIYLFDDNEAFTNETTDGTKSSDATGGSLFADYGYNFQVNKTVSFTLKGGYELIIDANRSIAYCDGCDSEKIDLDSGIYAQVGTTLDFTESFGIEMALNQYLNGDTDNALFMNLAFEF